MSTAREIGLQENRMESDGNKVCGGLNTSQVIVQMVQMVLGGEWSKSFS